MKELTSTTSPLMMVSSLWFLDVKSCVTCKQPSLDLPELKKNLKLLNIEDYYVHIMLNYSACAYHAFCGRCGGAHFAEI